MLQGFLGSRPLTHRVGPQHSPELLRSPTFSTASVDAAPIGRERKRRGDHREKSYRQQLGNHDRGAFAFEEYAPSRSNEMRAWQCLTDLPGL